MEAHRLGHPGVGSLLVLLDTSILIFLVEKPSTFLTDLGERIGKVELCVTDPVLRELSNLSRSRGGKAKRAKEALAFAESLRCFAQSGEADDSLVVLAQEKGAVVATLDRELVSSLRSKGLPVATPRGDRLLLLGSA